jgi:predicted lipid-binding transport protein (Tim44 family)
VLQSLGYGSLLVWGGLAASAMVATVSVAALREAVFPAWFGWLGALAAIVLLGAVIFFPMAALPIWVLIASVLLFRRSDAAEPARV